MKAIFLKRELSLIGAGTTLAASSVIGAGIFSLAGMAVEIAGPSAAFLSWLITIGSLAPLLYIFCCLKKRFGDRGNLVSYATDALGDWSEHGICLILLGSYVILTSVAVMMGSAYLENILGVQNRLGLSLILLMAGALLNLLGARFIQLANRLSVLTVFAILILFLIGNPTLFLDGWRAILTGLPQLSLALGPQIFSLSSLLFLALIGWESLSFLSAERGYTPKRVASVYRCSYLLVGALYLIFAVIGAGVIAQRSEGISLAGLIPHLKRLPFGSVFMVGTISIVIANVGALLCGGAQFLLAASRKKIFSATFSVCSRGDTPYMGIWYLLAGCLLILLAQKYFGFEPLMLMRIGTQNLWVIYLLCVATFFKRESGYKRWLVSVSAFVALALLFYGLTWEILIPILLIGIGLLAVPEKAIINNC